jgi:hypothetical protein
MIQELAFGVDQRPGLDQLRERDTEDRGGLLQEFGFGKSKLFKRRDF